MLHALLFKFLLNSYKNFIYLNSSRLKINMWSFVHINILYIYQRASIMVWLNNIKGLHSKFIKIIRFNFDFINLYKKLFVYMCIFIIITTVI